MSSGLHVQQHHVRSGIAELPAVQPSGAKVPGDVWHDLVHEMATVRALTAAALSAPDEESRLTLLGLIETEASEVSALLRQCRRNHYAAEPAVASSVLRDLVRTLGPTTTTALRLGYVPTVRLGIDRVSLRRVLRNLLENGIRAAGPQGSVELTARWSDRDVTISIADSGPGFGLGPAGLASRGLVIVRTLVEAAGGSLDIGTAALGGALVSVRFPVANLN